MEKEKIMPDLEQVVYEVIRFFMDWGLWNEIFIRCGGKVYTDANRGDVYYGRGLSLLWV